MKRIGFAALTAVLFVLGLAAPALAGYAPPPPDPGGTHGGTAFTGSNVSMGLVLLVALVVIGAVTLLVSRRRATARI
jgi:hypothetical protein